MAALRCSFFVQKKNRFCKMIPKRGRAYCGEHAHQEEGNITERIPCPLDPKHTVYKDQLSKHLKKCNSREKPKPVYYVEDINGGSADEDSSDEQTCLSERSREELEALLDKLKKAVQGQEAPTENILSHPALKEQLEDQRNGESALKHLRQQASILGHMTYLQLLGAGRSLGGHGRCYVEFGAGKGKLSHWIHQALKSHDCHGHFLSPDDYHFLLVERSSTRFKVDGKNQNEGTQFDRLQVDIQHLDLSKVSLLSQNNMQVVGVGKHLCGAATDLALRCLFRRAEIRGAEAEPPCKRLKIQDTAEPDQTGSVESKPDQTGSVESEPDQTGSVMSEPDQTGSVESEPDQTASVMSEPDQSASVKTAVGGVAIALCCHHRCEWRHYVGKQFFRQRGLGGAEFNALQRMSSWATCGLRPSQGSGGQEVRGQDGGSGGHQVQDGDHEEADHDDIITTPDTLNGVLSSEERQRIGSLCKLLINLGRVHFLEQKGYVAKLTVYAPPHVTLENVLLTAVPR